MKLEIIVCDESVSALDERAGHRAEPAAGFAGEFGLSYVFISHDLAVVKYMADSITLVMSKGEIVERGPAEDIYRNPQHEYTKQLLAAIPRGGGAAGHPA